MPAGSCVGGDGFLLTAAVPFEREALPSHTLLALFIFFFSP